MSEASAELLVIVGPHSGPLLRQLRAQGRDLLISYVPPEADLSEHPPEVPTAKNARELVGAILALPADPQTVQLQRVTLNGEPWGTAEELEAVGESVREALRARRIHLNTAERFGRLWVEQGLRNLPRVAGLPTIAPLRDAFRGKPCVIASPGPSLAAWSEHLPRLAGKALVMTCSHALAPLKAAGVLPDLVVATDPQNLERHFAGMPVEDYPALAFNMTLQTDLFDLPAKRIFTFVNDGPVDAWLREAVGEPVQLDTGGSVACSEFSLALFLGCDPIVLVGQDLGFPGDRFYVETSIDGNAELRMEEGTFVLAGLRPDEFPAGKERAEAGVATEPEGLLCVPAAGGGEVRTSITFYTFLKWFEAVVQSVHQGDRKRRLINCTVGGAHIEGMEHGALTDFLDPERLEPLDVEAILDAAAKSGVPGERRQRVHERVGSLHRGLETCLDLAQRCTRLAQAARFRKDKLEDLSRAEGELSAALAPVVFLSLLVQREIHEAREAAAQAKSLAANLAASQRLYRVVEEAGLELQEPFRRCLEALEG